MEEYYLGVILWANSDGSKGCLADLSGQTWLFADAIYNHGIRTTEVYQDGWKPTISVCTNPYSGKPYSVTRPDIVEFQIETHQRYNGSEYSRFIAIRAAKDFSQEDYQALMDARDKYDKQKLRERKQRQRRQEGIPQNGN